MGSGAATSIGFGAPVSVPAGFGATSSATNAAAPQLSGKFFVPWLLAAPFILLLPEDLLERCMQDVLSCHVQQVKVVLGMHTVDVSVGLLPDVAAVSQERTWDPTCVGRHPCLKRGPPGSFPSWM